MKVQDWIEQHPHKLVTVSLNASAEEAIELMLQETCARDIYVVDEDDKIVGHLSHIRLAQNLLLEHSPMHTRRQLMERVLGGEVHELMDTELCLTHPDDLLDEVLNHQLCKQLEDMPVVDDEGKILGAINLSEVLRVWIKTESQEES